MAPFARAETVARARRREPIDRRTALLYLSGILVAYALSALALYFAISFIF